MNVEQAKVGEMEFGLWEAIVAGLAGTAVMTAMLCGMLLMTGKGMDMAKMLGT